MHRTHDTHMHTLIDLTTVTFRSLRCCKHVSRAIKHKWKHTHTHIYQIKLNCRGSGNWQDKSNRVRSENEEGESLMH